MPQFPQVMVNVRVARAHRPRPVAGGPGGGAPGRGGARHARAGWCCAPPAPSPLIRVMVEGEDEAGGDAARRRAGGDGAPGGRDPPAGELLSGRPAANDRAPFADRLPRPRDGRRMHGESNAQAARRRKLEDARLACRERRPGAARCSTGCRPGARAEVLVCPPFVYLRETGRLLKDTRRCAGRAGRLRRGAGRVHRRGVGARCCATSAAAT